jgi:hypothetical protein
MSPLPILATGLAALSALPAFALTPDELGRKVAEQWQVDLVRVRPVTVEGQDGLAVTVMKPGGSFNGALGVATILVDPATGELMRQFRHGASGYSLPDTLPGPQPDIPGYVVRDRASR